jgi:hypothetical protein
VLPSCSIYLAEPRIEARVLLPTILLLPYYSSGATRTCETDLFNLFPCSFLIPFAHFFFSTRFSKAPGLWCRVRCAALPCTSDIRGWFLYRRNTEYPHDHKAEHIEPLNTDKMNSLPPIIQDWVADIQEYISILQDYVSTHTQEWTDYQPLVTTIVAVLSALYVVLYRLQSVKRHPDEPPVVTARVPYLGHLLGMALWGGRYVKGIG